MKTIEIPRRSRRGGRPPKEPKEGVIVTHMITRDGLQDPGPRTRALLEKHGIASILKAMKDEKYLAETFSAYDGMLIIGLANSLNGSGEERERMFARMFGKVPDRTINLNINLDASPEQLAQNAGNLLSKIEPSLLEETESECVTIEAESACDLIED